MAASTIIHQFFPRIPSPAPNILRRRLSMLFNVMGYNAKHRFIFYLEGLSSKKAESIVILRFRVGCDRAQHFISDRLPILKILRLWVKTSGASPSASTNPNAHTNAGAIGDIIGYDFCDIHSTPLSASSTGTPSLITPSVYQPSKNSALGSISYVIW